MFSFSERAKVVESQKLLRRIMDASSLNLFHEGSSRGETRSNRTIPVLLLPYEDGRVVLQKAVYAVSKDLSSQGIALILSEPLHAERVVVGLLVDDRPRFLLGEVRQASAVGGGFWQVGVATTDVFEPTGCDSLSALGLLTDALRPTAGSCRS